MSVSKPSLPMMPEGQKGFQSQAHVRILCVVSSPLRVGSKKQTGKIKLLSHPIVRLYTHKCVTNIVKNMSKAW